MSDVTALSGISGQPFDSAFLSALLLLYLVLLLLSLIFLLMVHSPDFFSQNIFHYFIRDRLFCMAVVE